MRKKSTRALSLLLALVMVLGLLPGTVWASKTGITVSLSIFDQGIPGTCEDGALMLQRPVTVEDRNEDGNYSLDEALAAAHAAYYPDGEDGYGLDGADGFVTKLWGEETSATGFYRNDAVTAAVGEEYLAEGDRITAFVYSDQELYTDRYSYFTRNSQTVCVDEEFELKLMGSGYDENWLLTEEPVATAPIGVYAKDGTFAVSEEIRGERLFEETYAQAATGADGTAKLSIVTPGTYTLTAQFDSSNYITYDSSGQARPNRLVPPVCVVTVLSEEDYAAYQDQLVLEQAKELLTWDSIKGANTDSRAVTENLSIPSELTVDEKQVEVSWSCDDTTGALSVSNYYGSWAAYVDRPAAEDVSCTLTAVLAYGDETAEKEFHLTIKAEGVDENKQSVVTYGDLLTGIAAGYATSADPWVVLEMAAYNGSNVKDEGGYGDASAVAAALADAAIGSAVETADLDAVDISGPYAIYTIPYLSLAYQAAGCAQEDPERMAAMKTSMVEYLNGLESNYAEVDDMAPILAALAPYYHEGDREVTAAVDGAVAWLSGQQGQDGTFANYGISNANSTALAVVALSALGIDAHTDGRFIKNDRSAMDGLFSFALADHTGFGYKGNVLKNALATEQGFRALVSYARFRESGAPYNIYLQAKDSRSAVTAPDISATAKPPEVGSSPSKVRVTVSVMVPPEGGEEGQYTYRYDSGEYTNLLGEVKNVSVSSGSTALEVLTGVLDDAGLSYTEHNGYISGIDYLAEGDHGPNSGWQYMVDGTAPTESASTYTFNSNAKTVWYYTDDYTKEKSAASWNGGNTSDISVQVEKNGDGAYSVTLPGDSEGPVLVTIPDVGDGQLVVVVGTDGTEQVVRKSLVENGTARFFLVENAVVKVTDYTSEFGDVAQNDWYASAVDFVSGRGLFSGVAGDKFAPGLTLDRGMVATVLYALEQPGEQSGALRFSDVDGNHWCARGVAWASGTGIVAGYGDGRFGPQDPVTREQLALMLYQYAQMLGMDTQGRGTLSRFTDGGQVAPWAGDAVAWALDAGLLSGRPDGKLDPAGTATRAEAAVMLRQFVARMLG